MRSYRFLLLSTFACSPAPAPSAPAVDVQSAAEAVPPPRCPDVAAAPEEPAPAPAPAPCDCPAPEPGAPVDDGAELVPSAVGPATGGPRLGTHRCEFRESVDTYNRQCQVKKNVDGSLQVIAKGTDLNPDNGFDFSLHGGPHELVAQGTLNAFQHCAGPFVARAVTVIDRGVTTYELRFREHCMIVVR